VAAQERVLFLGIRIVVDQINILRPFVTIPISWPHRK